MSLALAIVAGALLMGCGLDESPTSLTGEPRSAGEAGEGSPEGGAEKASRGLTGNWISQPRLFASGVRLISIAGSPTQLLATTEGGPAPLVSITETGEMRAFATGFTLPGSAPWYVEVAPGLGAFPPGAILLGAGVEVWQLAPDGRAALALTSLPALDGNIAGLAFDGAGSLHYDLVALTDSGTVYRIDGGGNALRIGSVGPGGRGLTVASTLFGRYAGNVMVAFPSEHTVRALDAAGNLSVALLWSGVSGAWTVPDDPRSFGDTEATLFVATESGDLFRYPLRDLVAHGGGILLTSDLCSGSGLTTCRSNNFTTRSFSRYMGRERAAAFVHRPAYTQVNIEIHPGLPSKTIDYGSTTLVPVALLAGPGFSPQLLEGGDVRLAGATFVETPRQRMGVYQDVNGDGKVDLVLRFRPADMQLVPGQAVLPLEGTGLAGDQVRGAGSVQVLIP